MKMCYEPSMFKFDLLYEKMYKLDLAYQEYIEREPK
jgi:hypothetical protein